MTPRELAVAVRATEGRSIGSGVHRCYPRQPIRGALHRSVLVPSEQNDYALVAAGQPGTLRADVLERASVKTRLRPLTKHLRAMRNRPGGRGIWDVARALGGATTGHYGEAMRVDKTRAN